MTLLRTLANKAALVSAALLILAAFSANAQAGLPDVPEIDPSSMISALTLFSGGLLILNDRRRRAK